MAKFCVYIGKSPKLHLKIKIASSYGVHTHLSFAMEKRKQTCCCNLTRLRFFGLGLCLLLCTKHGERPMNSDFANVFAQNVDYFWGHLTSNEWKLKWHCCWNTNKNGYNEMPSEIPSNWKSFFFLTSKEILLHVLL